MTSPFDSSSPFLGDTNSADPSQKPSSLPNTPPLNNEQPLQDEFVIHTMQEDLNIFKTKGDLHHQPKPQPMPEIKEKVEEKVEQIAPTPEKKTSLSPQSPVKIEAVEPNTKKMPLEATVAPKKSAAVKIILVIVFLLIIGIIGLGGYYFWITKKANQQAIVAPNNTQQPLPTPAPVAPTTPAAPVQSAPIQQPQDKYSKDKPNYLTLDLTTLSADQIKTTLTNVATDLKTTSSQSLYEFTVVDSNNNPIAFPIFATAAKLNLSQTLLSSLASEFSLFFFNDNGNIRLALEANSKNKATTSQELTKEEKTLPVDANFLFLNNTPEVKSGTFATSTYNGSTIRYINLKKDLTLSIDYTLKDSKLLIGTSKATLRALLDDVLTNVNATSSNNSKNTTTSVGNKTISTDSQQKNVPATATSVAK